MSATRVYFAGALAAGARVTLAPGAAHHVARVLRKDIGDELVVFNGAGGEFDASIEAIDRAEVTLAIGQWHSIERESPLAVTLAQGISGADRMDYTVQKAVELGVATIQPLATHRSVAKLDAERAQKRIEHWRAVVTSSCEQCGRNRVPPVAEIEQCIDWLEAARENDPNNLRLLLSPRAQVRLRDLQTPPQGVVLLVGPEGGFTPEEESAALAADFTAVRLGPRILRTETVALAALAAMHALWGDF